MALSYVEGADSRQNLGMSGIIQHDVVTPAASDYPTGGYPINPQNWGMGVIHGLIPIAHTGTAATYVWVYVPAASGSVTPAYSGNLFVYETGAAVSGPLAQVAAATDLSGGTVKLLAFGF